MVSYFMFLVFVAGFTAIGLSLFLLPRQLKVGSLLVVFLIVMANSIALPVLASNGAEVVSESERSVAGAADTSPQMSQYQGFEHAGSKGNVLSDKEITSRIRQNVSDDLKLSVSNGAVRISGSVSDRQTAQEIVQSIKEVPGVIEIAYDLGLNG